MGKNITCKINEHLTIGLFNVIERQGHDDSVPFDADLYFFFNGAKKGLKVGFVSNDGWGGPNNILIYNPDTQEGKQNKTELNIAKEYIENHYKFHYRGNEYPCILDMILSCMVGAVLYEGREVFDISRL